MTDYFIVGALVLVVLGAGLVWVIGGNALIGSVMSGVHRELRAELAGQRVLFEEPAVPTTVTVSAMLSWNRRWVRADVLITERAAVLFQRNRFIAQPPIQLLRSADDPGASTRSMVGAMVVTAPPRVEEGRVVIEGRGKRIGKWKLVIKTARPDELIGALAVYLHPR